MSDAAVLHVSLEESTTITKVSPGVWRVEGRSIEATTMEAPHPAVAAALERLANGGAPHTELAALAPDDDDGAGLLAFLSLMFQLSSACALRFTVIERSRPIAELRWLREGLWLDPPRVEEGQRYALSRFTVLRSAGGVLVVESPLGRAQVRLVDGAAALAVASLAEAADAAELSRRVPALGAGAALRLVDLLLFAGAVAPVDEQGRIETEECPPLGWWEPHDLWFHTRSRRGRHANPYGGTFVHAGKAPAPPLVRAREGEEWIPLHKPNLEHLLGADEPFSAVLERRRSVRDYGEAPITVEQLGEFLFRSARIRMKMAADNGMEHGLKPAPSGGAIHEIDVYAVVARCTGLEPGLYRYDPLAHALGRVDGMTPAVEQLLEEAWITGDRRSRPQVMLALVARFGRMQWKYESIVYSVILKNVGALFATMYLVATAMKLAPCALGGGDSDLFAEAAGIDYLTETTVGEFLLGEQGIAMATRRTETIARAYYEALASGDADTLRRAVSPGFALESSGRIFELPEYLATLAAYRRSFPDLQRVVRELTVRGRRAVAVVENSGTHTRTFLSHRPTRRRFHALSIDVLEVERGVVSRATSVFDTLTMLAQLGLYAGAPPSRSRT